MAGEQVRQEQGAPHEPGDADGAVGARFVPNRSADVGTGAEPPQRRGLAERCELGTTRAPAPRPVQGLNARNARGNLLPEGEGQDEGEVVSNAQAAIYFFEQPLSWLRPLKPSACFL
jgi:hypothetical protein